MLKTPTYRLKMIDAPVCASSLLKSIIFDETLAFHYLDFNKFEVDVHSHG